MWALVGLVVISGMISGYSHYLLQRTGEGRRALQPPAPCRADAALCRSASSTRRRTGDLVSRVGSDTTLLRAVLTQGLVEAIGGALTFISKNNLNYMLIACYFIIAIICL